MDTLIPARWRTLALVSLVVGAAILAAGWIPSDEGEDSDGGVLGWLAVVVVMLLTFVLVWKFVVGPRLGSIGSAAAVPALILGILSPLLGFMYWTGFVYAVAPAAIALGRESETDAKGKAGWILGAIGLALGVIGGFVDAVL